MWESVFDSFLSRLIVLGQLHVTLPDGRVKTYGTQSAPVAKVAITDPSLMKALCLRPELALGEGYMDGTLVPENDDLEALMVVLIRNYQHGELPGWVKAVKRMRFLLRGWLQRNSPRSSKSNVAHHYDISDDLYRLFLDEDMQYSCAYFSDPQMSLEEAQTAKKAHIARKLCIEPGMRVLDIGCGWGGMALTLARDHGAHVTGVTLSENQLATARARAEAAGLADQTDFRLLDYRLLEERFDRIVSVGMLEHVGAPHYGEYFAKVSELLTDDGVALIHTIGRTEVPQGQSEWINKYIFPGGYVPSLSMLAPPIEAAQLWTTDLEVLRLHYALTLRHWSHRFNARLDEVRARYDERFVRMWNFYLTACYLAFEEQNQAVFQFQLAKTADAVPLTRDYLHPKDEAAQHRQAAE